MEKQMEMTLALAAAMAGAWAFDFRNIHQKTLELVNRK